MNQRMLELRSEANEDGACVVYVMSRDQRAHDNHALLAAQAEALEHEVPLIVVFNLYTKLEHRRREHFEFMIDGLKEVQATLESKNIPFIITIGDMPTNVARLANNLTPRSLYFDFSPLRGSRAAQKKVARDANFRVVVVDTHNVVPVWIISDKEEFAAHTIRRKLHNNLEEWAVDPGNLKKHPHTFSPLPHSASWADVDKTVAAVPKNGIDHGFHSGEAAAMRRLTQFIETGLKDYGNDRNNALVDAQSNLSPYLHYGQISALRILLTVMDKKSHPPQLLTSFKLPTVDGTATEADGIDAFIEELIVRRELADNYCFYNSQYDSLQGAKDWAKKTLESHKDDPRPFTYTKEQFENAKTHDDLWNAAQMQLRKTGKIHGYMRMYWAKKFLEWTNTPETAIRWAVELNDTYHLDGGDPNGYVGVMWSIAGIHDRPWFDREIFGTIRYMAASGVNKRFDSKTYIATWMKQD